MGFFPQRRLNKVLEVASELKPDIILCHLAENMLLALKLQKYLKIPIVLHVEIASKIAGSKFVGRLANQICSSPNGTTNNEDLHIGLGYAKKLTR